MRKQSVRHFLPVAMRWRPRCAAGAVERREPANETTLVASTQSQINRLGKLASGDVGSTTAARLTKATTTAAAHSHSGSRRDCKPIPAAAAMNTAPKAQLAT